MEDRNDDELDLAAMYRRGDEYNRLMEEAAVRVRNRMLAGLPPNIPEDRMKRLEAEDNPPS